ncbi:hypothetical protein DASC09_022320 [Saccharomycopsis crataegensis]|uniref:Monopolar spindle protein 2 n=1 Tax=Saccharomycopsis crataegensis TaxID=43959 RepID=A0AAV5QJX5_9ASCO|nr:hypothetical protein DASC09_022320 [Saccharomycopsis crataegensis]
MSSFADIVFEECWDTFKRPSTRKPGQFFVYRDDFWKLHKLLEQKFDHQLLSPEQIEELANYLNDYDNSRNTSSIIDVEPLKMMQDDVKGLYSTFNGTSDFQQFIESKGITAKGLDKDTNIMDDPHKENINQGTHSSSVPADDSIVNPSDIKQNIKPPVTPTKVFKSRIPTAVNFHHEIYSANTDSDEDIGTTSNNSQKPRHKPKPKRRLSSKVSTPKAAIERDFSIASLATSTPLGNRSLGNTCEKRDQSSSNDSSRSIMVESNKLQAIIDNKEQDIEYRDKEITRLQSEITDFKQSLQKQEQSQKQLISELEHNKNHIQSLEKKNAKYEQLSRDVAALRSANSTLRASNATLSQSNEDSLRQVEKVSETLVRLESLQSQVARLQQENEKLRQERLTNEVSLEQSSLGIKNIELKAKLEQTQEELARLKMKSRDKTLISTKEYRQLRNSKLKTLKELDSYSKKLRNQSLVLSSFDDSQTLEARIQNFLEHNRPLSLILVVVAIVLLTTILKASMYGTSSFNEQPPNFATQDLLTSSPSGFKWMWKKWRHRMNAISRLEYNVDEVISGRESYDPRFYGFMSDQL